MKEVYQTRDNTVDGNCLAACLASIFEDDIDSYPEIPNEPTWAEIMNKHLIEKHGVYLFPVTTSDPELYLKGYHLVVGDNVSHGCTHCMVGFNGQVVFNPSLSGNEITNHRYLLLVKHIL
jgi:hypothetical protein